MVIGTSIKNAAIGSMPPALIQRRRYKPTQSGNTHHRVGVRQTARYLCIDGSGPSAPQLKEHGGSCDGRGRRIATLSSISRALGSSSWTA